MSFSDKEYNCSGMKMKVSVTKSFHNKLGVCDGDNCRCFDFFSVKQ